MERCQNCGGTSFVVTDAGLKPEVYCLRCSWRRFIDDGWCTAATQPGWRCGRPAGINGRCTQHVERHQIWDDAFRNLFDDPEWLGEAYREIFTRALWRAGLLAQYEAIDESRVANLDDRAATLERERNESAGASVVYFVRRDTLIKIGTTKNLKRRLAALDGGSCAVPGTTLTPVQLLASTPGDCQLERSLHRQFADYRVHGEWFSAHPRILRLVARYQRRASDLEMAMVG